MTCDAQVVYVVLVLDMLESENDVQHLVRFNYGKYFLIINQIINFNTYASFWFFIRKFAFWLILESWKSIF